MSADDDRPWDKRLLDRISRDSATARSSAWSPFQLVAYGVIWIALALISGDAAWYAIAGLSLLTAAGRWLYARGR
jgi:hypothetical protein